MRQLREAAERLGHAVEKKGLRRDLTPVALRGGHQLFCLRHGQRHEQVREQRFQGATKPDVEEVRQISVADVVIVRWVC